MVGASTYQLIRNLVATLSAYNYHIHYKSGNEMQILMPSVDYHYSSFKFGTHTKKDCFLNGHFTYHVKETFMKQWQQFQSTNGAFQRCHSFDCDSSVLKNAKSVIAFFSHTG